MSAAEGGAAISAVSWPEHLFMVGCGNMAGAMLSRWLACGLPPERVTVLRPSGRPVADGVRVITDYPDVVPAGYVLLGMKPAMVADVAARLSPLVGPGHKLLSILAGISAEALGRSFPDAGGIVRVMPNTPVGIGRGVSALFAGQGTEDSAKEAVTAFLSPLGLAEWIADESQFDLVTALSGCGPAFVFRFIDALGSAAARLGLPADQAARLALATVDGAAGLATDADVSPAVLADRVASPGGMTREGLNVLDADDRLIALMEAVLRAARDRGAELARMAGAA